MGKEQDLLNFLHLGQFTAGGTKLNDIGLAAARGIEGKNLAGAGRGFHAREPIARNNLFSLVAGHSRGGGWHGFLFNRNYSFPLRCCHGFLSHWLGYGDRLDGLFLLRRDLDRLIIPIAGFVKVIVGIIVGQL
jgi:hypothetical protein